MTHSELLFDLIVSAQGLQRHPDPLTYATSAGVELPHNMAAGIPLSSKLET